MKLQPLVGLNAFQVAFAILVIAGTASFCSGATDDLDNGPVIDGASDAGASAECPPGSLCVRPFRCTTLISDLQARANSADIEWQPAAAQDPEQIYRRCSSIHLAGINLTSAGICCPTAQNWTTAKIANLTLNLDHHPQPHPSVQLDDGRKMNRKREISPPDYDHFAGSNVTSTDSIRSKRCIIGGECKVKHRRYRRYDGRCNNIGPGGSLWGSAGYPMERILPPAYGDGVWAARTISTGGLYLPSARSISVQLFSDLHVPHKKFNVLLMQFGQFLVHDITKNKVFSEKAKCCLDDGSHRLAKPHPACLPIRVSYKDPFYGKFGVKCLEFVRTAIASRKECPIGHGRQISAVTSFIDGSGIYGNSPEEAHELRTHQGGRMKSRKHRRYHIELPPEDKNPGACSKTAEMCFKVGDDRVNQIISLVAVHTLFLREHNRIAGILEDLNPHWKDEILFQEARRIVGAELQHIVYTEYLPKIIGPHLMDQYNLYASKGYSSFYDPHINPAITSEFAAAAFRFGHSTVPGQLELPTGLVDTHKTFFDPTDLREPGYFDELFRGLSLQPMQKTDDMFTHSLTRFLNPKDDHPYGKDLVAINIQRGRDHALQPYNSYLRLAGHKVAKRFEDFGALAGPQLNKLYASPYDVDLFVGGILEPPVPGGVVGATFGEMIADQFSRLKEGDRYFYSNGPGSNPSHFTRAQLEELQKVTLAGILCANANRQKHFEVAVDAFTLPHPDSNPLVSCRSELIPEMDLKWWKD